jgi:eukaryotic-like serine/threonine-protein kinase
MPTGAHTGPPLPPIDHRTNVLRPGQAFGNRYHVIRLLGAGGMGAVYQVWDDELGVSLALKVIRPEAVQDPEAARDLERRFKRELLLARQVTHKHVVRIHDLGEIDGIKYITMPYVHGSDLATVLRKEGRLPVDQALRIARQVTSGLVAAHEAGVVHRDLKPANIMIDEEGSALIMDFGIARSIAGEVGGTVAGAVVGTLEYMAPEQAQGRHVDQRADIYAFGLILRDMLVGGRRASGAESAVAELMARMQQAPPPLRSLQPDIPEGVDQLIARCLQPDPGARYQTSAELAADLDRLAPDGRATQALTAPALLLGSATRQSARAFRPATRGLVAAALLVVLIAGLATWRFWPGGAREAQAGAEPAVALAVLPFRNVSGDPAIDWLGGSIADLLRADLGGTTQLRTVSSDRVHQILQDLRVAPASMLDRATIRRVADFSSADRVIWGQYVQLGEELRIDATLEDVERQQRVPLKTVVTNHAGLTRALDDLGKSVLEHLTLSPQVRRELQARVLKPSSESLVALRHYNQGIQFAREGRHSDAREEFERAAEEDPGFALAYSRLAEAYVNLRRDGEAEQVSRRALDLSADLPPGERHLIRARHASIVNDQKQAIEAYEQLVDAQPEDLDVVFQLAQLYERTGALDQAREQYTRVVERDPKFIDGLLALGRTEIRRRNPQDALEPLNRALSLTIQMENEEARGNVLQALGIAYKRMDRSLDALRHYQESLEIKRRLGQKGGIAATLSEIAQIHNRLGRPDEALTGYNEALALRREIGDVRGAGNTLIDLGVFHQDRGHYEEALKAYREALQIQREVGNSAYQALCLNNIGTIHLARGLYDDALTHFERALELRQSMNVESEIAETLQNLGETFLKKGQYEQALGHYMRALDLRRSAGDRRGAAIAAYSIAGLFTQQGQFGAALKATEEALTTLRDLNDRSFWYAEMLSGYGSALTTLGRFDDATRILSEAEQLAGELGNDVLLAQTMGYQAKVVLYEGNTQLARTRLDRAVQLASGTDERPLQLSLRAQLTRLTGRERPGPAIVTTFQGIAKDAESMGLRHLALECAVDAAEVQLALKQFNPARQELERVLRRSREAGLRWLAARAAFLLAGAVASAGVPGDASAYYGEALGLLEEIQREAGSDVISKRVDLASMYEEAKRRASPPVSRTGAP